MESDQCSLTKRGDGLKCRVSFEFVSCVGNMDTLTFWATIACSFFIGSSVEYDENGKMISEDNDLEYELDVQFMQT